RIYERRRSKMDWSRKNGPTLRLPDENEKLANDAAAKWLREHDRKPKWDDTERGYWKRALRKGPLPARSPKPPDLADGTTQTKLRKEARKVPGSNRNRNRQRKLERNQTLKHQKATRVWRAEPEPDY